MTSTFHPGRVVLPSWRRGVPRWFSGVMLCLLGGLPGPTAQAQTLLIPAGSVWRYLDNGADPGVAWRTTNYNDSAWATGPAELGYGDDTDGRPERTRLNYGADPNNKYLTYYFRRTFQVVSPTAFTNLSLGVVRDDGVVVYLNGTEVFRNNLPTGTITATTTALTNVNAGPDEYTFYPSHPSPGLLRPGTNLVAVEIHQNARTSSDLSFDLFLAGSTATQATSRLLFHVATNGNDDWSGLFPQPSGGDGPFATLERARDVVRSFRLAGFAAPGEVVIEVGGGLYPLERRLDFTDADSGTATSPVTYRARSGEEVRLSGGRVVSGFARVTDAATLARLDPAARGQVWQADLRAQGLTHFSPPQAGSSWAQSDPGLEVFFQDQPMTLARWPNEGYVKIVQALGPTPVDVRGTVGTVEGIFSYEGDRPARWVGQPDVMLHGFWFWDWADQRQKVQSITTASNLITLASPWHTYGYRDGQWFYAYNLLPELDRLGEWYLDRSSGLLYFWPPAPLTNGTVVVSCLTNLVTLTNVSFLTLQGFTFEGCQKDAVTLSGGQTNTIRACVVRNVGKNGLRLANSPGSGVTGCDLYYCGESGVLCGGGDRPTLTPGGLYVENNRIHHYSRWNPVYHAGLSLSGVGNRARHNLIHDAPHEGIAFGGNEHLIEYNEFYNLVSESNDAGVIYAGRTWTARGHVIRYNYFHHIYGFARKGCNCVYLDDQFSSAQVYGNLFYDVPTAILIGGGRDNAVENNVFVNCDRALSLDARGLGWAASGFSGLSNDLVSLPYQTPPWSTRYPQLTNLFNEDPMAPRNNVVTRNISWNGAWTSIETAAQPGVILSNNLVGTDPRFVDTKRLDFRLQADSPAFPLGFQPLPFEQIGPDPNLAHAPWPPGVTLTHPPPDTDVAQPAAVPLEAVLSDPEHRAGAVEFWVGNARLAATDHPAHALTWSNPPAGHFTLTARVVSSNGSAGSLNYARLHVLEALVATGSVWKYYDGGLNLGTSWRATNYNDNAWLSGPAELGYGDDQENRPEATVIRYGPNSNSKYITYYFRRPFTVADPGQYTNLVLGLMRDDGAVVYLNGDEVFRSNLTNATITYTTPALVSVSGSGETTFYQTNVNPTRLRRGTNWLAVEVHQANGQSTDLSFDLFLRGQTTTVPPRLQAEKSGPGLLLSWPATAADCTLETTSSLPGPPWETLPGTATLTNGRIRLPLPSADRHRFFRLAQP